MQVKNSISLKHAYVIYNFKKNNQFIGLKDFSYEFKKNKIYCIVGQSGSGKSTLISLFNGLTRLTYGDIVINDITIKGKRYLDKAALGLYKLNNNELSNLVKKQIDDINNKNYYLVQSATNIKLYDIKCWIDSINNNVSTSFFKVPKKKLSNIGINNIKNNFYVVEVLDNKFIKQYNLYESIKEIKQIDLIDKFDHSIKNKKIKNYKELRKQIGMVSQFPEFQLFRQTVLEDVMFGPIVLGINKDEAKKRAVEELNKLRIYESHFNNTPFALSGGQKRRVAIAGILAINGDTLIFDEPTAGLDPVGEADMIQLMLRSKKEGKTVFVVTHSMEQVLEIADEVLVIHEGRLIENGEPYKIFNNKELLAKTNIEVPYIVNMVNKLVAKDKKFSPLLDKKPRTIEELANLIVKLKKGDKK